MAAHVFQATAEQIEEQGQPVEVLHLTTQGIPDQEVSGQRKEPVDGIIPFKIYGACQILDGDVKRPISEQVIYLRLSDRGILASYERGALMPHRPDDDDD